MGGLGGRGSGWRGAFFKRAGQVEEDEGGREGGRGERGVESLVKTKTARGPNGSD